MKKYSCTLFSRFTGHAMRWQYFDSKADAIAYAKANSRYFTSYLSTYENGEQVKFEPIA